MFAECSLAHDTLVLRGTQISDPAIVRVTVKGRWHTNYSGSFKFFTVQLMHTNYYETVKLLKSFKIIIVAPTCFSLHKPSSGSTQVHASPKLHC